MFLAVLLALLGAPSRAQTIAPNFPVADGTVYCSVLSGNTLYLGGAFNELGKLARGEAAVDPATALRIPGFPHTNGKVFAVAPDGAGGWYIGGEFTHVGPVYRRCAAHVLADLTVSPWDPDVAGDVFALAVEGTKVYIGGQFEWVARDESRKNFVIVDATTG